MHFALPPIEWNPRVELRVFGPPFILGCCLIAFRPSRRVLVDIVRPWLAISLLGVGVAALLIYLAAVIAAPFFIDQSEYGVANISWWWASGHPMYPRPGTLNVRDIYPYGPLTFEMIGGAMGALGPSIVASKLPGVIASVGGLLCFFLALRRLGASSVLAMALVAALLLIARATWVQARLDPVSTAFASAALLAATCQPSARMFALIGALAGLSFALKIHGFLYTIPALTILWEKGGRPTHLAAFAIAALIFGVAPFLAAGVDVHDYAGVLLDASRDGLATGIFISNILFIGMFAVAALLLGGGFPGDAPGRAEAAIGGGSAFLWSLGVCALVVSVIASKPLAGPHHLYPFLVYVGPLVIAAARRRGEAFAPLASVLLVFLVLAFQPVSEMQKIGKRAPDFWSTSLAARDLVSELRASEPAEALAFCNPGDEATWNIASSDEPTTLSTYAVLAGAPLGAEHSRIEGTGIWICATNDLPPKLPTNCVIAGNHAPFAIVRCR